ncbi:ATP-binding cassette domain-containing protein [Marinoscillum sp. MHG1-6]|uniref:ATP-binding cassette domain-containing protein n=1 Tax=Marinoscillum sp. MHG1-6 TaxID=2959627 RepID=UPI0021586581|nr:ATP-binding cassette domain-containing protein [Marinoscillum sp. MHG1-6]
MNFSDPVNSLIIAKDAVIKFRAQTIFENLNFEWPTGQHWAIVGSNGSGKSALLQTLAGKFIVGNGSLRHPFSIPFEEIEKPGNSFFTYHDLIQLVDIRHEFRNKSNLKEFYFQQRYNSDDADDAPTVSEYLSEQQKEVSRQTYWSLELVKQRFNLGYLWEKSVIKLSNGEGKRLRLAAALLKHPKVLLIDNTFAGLDVATRAYFDQLFNEIIKSGINLAMVCNPYEIPSCITNVLVLDKCRIIKQVDKSSFDPEMDCPTEKHDVDFKALDQEIISHQISSFHTIVDMRRANVRYGDLYLLKDINWKIEQGECWALSGPNGAGKSTLLSLINGDHPQAYACDLRLFGRKRGSGESIWDIKRNIGFMSPELYQYFPSYFTCLEVVVSSFYEALGVKKKGTDEQVKQAEFWLDTLDLTKCKYLKLNELSSSGQRLCLLARALVKAPALLILDEPCQGLDHSHQEQFRQIIDHICELSKTTLIYVTHYQEQLPKCINKRLELSL